MNGAVYHTADVKAVSRLFQFIISAQQIRARTETFKANRIPEYIVVAIADIQVRSRGFATENIRHKNDPD